MGGVRKLAAVLLLALSAFSAAYGMTPLMRSVCVCDHPADVPCDCPHHRGGGDDAPPCHRHMHMMKKAKPSAPVKGLAFRNHCGARPPMLVLAIPAPLPELRLYAIAPVELRLPPAPDVRALERAVTPELRPPR